ncbi:cupin-like domain-containing protein [Archangium sp.]|jgi:50S ribosomal protein L16 3-hydroxylase|uniref:cupin-like domain-containing protein n=1 Tax=Archangium sp. TaxID=1872627 RepID=UPI003899FA6D
MSFRLPTEFWKSFAQDVWRKQPRVFENPFGGRLFAPPEELFRMAAAETERFAQTAGSRSDFSCHVNVGKAMVLQDQTRLMPNAADGSFQGWDARLNREEGIRGAMYFMNSTQRRSPLLYQRYREFTDGLFTQIGLPTWKINTDMFIGDYPETPFGVHKDVTDNFHFVALGRKRILLWPYESLLHYVQPGMDVSEIEFSLQLRGLKEIREQAIVLEGGPGDVMYWPGHFWHCAEGTGSLVASSSCYIDLFYSPLMETFPDVVQETLHPIRELHPATPYSPERRQELAGAIPEQLRDTTRRVSQGLKALVEGGLERELELTWLRYVSGGGFLRVPPPATGVVLDEARALKPVPESNLIWRKLANGEIACAANGLVRCYPESRGLVETLQRLAGGGSHRPGALLDEAKQEHQGSTVVWSREKLRELLTTLVEQRALVPA